MHAFNSSTEEAEAGRFLSLNQPEFTDRIPRVKSIQRNPILKNNNKNKTIVNKQTKHEEIKITKLKAIIYPEENLI